MGVETMAMAAIGATALGAIQGSQAAKDAGKAEQQLWNLNAQSLNYQAESAIERGRIDVADFRTDVSRLMGAQKAGAAAQNIDVNSGSALEVRADTARQAEEDIERIRHNAKLEAWGFSNEATQATYQGKLAKLAGKNKAKGTLLGGAADIFSMGAKF